MIGHNLRLIAVSVFPDFVSMKTRPNQGPLISDGRNRSKWTGHYVGLSKTLKSVKIVSKFLKDTFKWTEFHR